VKQQCVPWNAALCPIAAGFRNRGIKCVRIATLTFQGHVIDVIRHVTVRFATPIGVTLVQSESSRDFEILWLKCVCVTVLTFLGHVTSSVTSSIDAHHVISYRCSIDTNPISWAILSAAMVCGMWFHINEVVEVPSLLWVLCQARPAFSLCELWTGCSRSRAARFRVAQFRAAQYRAERFSAAAGCLLASLTSDQRNSAMLGHIRPCVFCCQYTWTLKTRLLLEGRFLLLKPPTRFEDVVRLTFGTFGASVPI